MTTIIVHTIAEYLKRKDKFINATMIRKKGKSFILENGKKIPILKWQMKNPFPVYRKLNDKGANPDTRLDFLNKN